MTIVVNVGQAQKLQKVSPSSFQFFTRLAAVFAEERFEISHQMLFSNISLFPSVLKVPGPSPEI